MWLTLLLFVYRNTLVARHRPCWLSADAALHMFNFDFSELSSNETKMSDFKLKARRTFALSIQAR